MSKIRINDRNSVNQFGGDKAREDAWRDTIRLRFISYFACIEYAYKQLSDAFGERVSAYYPSACRYFVHLHNKMIDLSRMDVQRFDLLIERLASQNEKRVQSFYKSMLKTAQTAKLNCPDAVTWCDVIANVCHEQKCHFTQMVFRLGRGNYYDSAYVDAMAMADLMNKHLGGMQHELETDVNALTPSEQSIDKFGKLVLDVSDEKIINRAVKYVDKQLKQKA